MHLYRASYHDHMTCDVDVDIITCTIRRIANILARCLNSVSSSYVFAARWWIGSRQYINNYTLGLNCFKLNEITYISASCDGGIFSRWFVLSAIE